MNLTLNDPTVPGPGEMVAGEGPATTGLGLAQGPGSGGADAVAGAASASLRSHRSASPQPLSGSPLLSAGNATADPHHRAPSLGDLHQELEAEQEAQVVRIRFLTTSISFLVPPS